MTLKRLLILALVLLVPALSIVAISASAPSARACSNTVRLYSYPALPILHTHCTHSSHAGNQLTRCAIARIVDASVITHSNWFRFSDRISYSESKDTWLRTRVTERDYNVTRSIRLNGLDLASLPAPTPQLRPPRA